MTTAISPTLREDIEQILSCGEIPWKRLFRSSLLVTGATGLVGGLIVRALSAANARHSLGLRLLAHGRDKTKGQRLVEECGVEFVASDIRESIPVGEGEIDHIVHCASITKSSDMVEKPVEVMMTAVDGTRNVLELARKKQAKSVVYLSSMEIYGQGIEGEVREADSGRLDLTSARSSYPESKRFCESLCACYFAEYGVPVKIARLARTFGAGAPDDASDQRVASQFVRKALAGNDIELHTRGGSVANCCSTADAVSGLLLILLEGKNGETYNVANPGASATIREMAEIVANGVGGGKIRCVIDVPEDMQRRGYAPDVAYRLNADKLMALGWSPKQGLVEMARRMADDWKWNGGAK